MMKIKCAQSSGRPLLILGLSHPNIDKLRADGLKVAIKIDGKEYGIDCDIWITAAPTEREMLQAFRELIGPDTKVHIDKRHAT